MNLVHELVFGREVSFINQNYRTLILVIEKTSTYVQTACGQGYLWNMAPDELQGKICLIIIINKASFQFYLSEESGIIIEISTMKTTT